MAFQVEIALPKPKLSGRWYRERNPDFADRWFRGLMNAIATLQEKPQRCALAIEHEIFPEVVRQLLYGKSKSTYRILFTIREQTVYVLYIRHSAQAVMTLEDLDNENPADL